MSKIWILTKVQLGSLFSSNTKKITPMMKWGIAGIGLLLFGMMLLYSFGLGYSLDLMGKVVLLPGVMMAFSCILTLITTIYKVNGVLFGFKDYDIVMALPVKASQVIASRILLLYLYDLAFTFLVMIPAGAVYAVIAAPSPLFYPVFVLSLLFIPLIPLIVASAVGSLITAIASRFRHSGIVNTVLGTAAVVGICAISFTVNSGQSNLGDLGQMLIGLLGRFYPPVYLYIDGVSQLKPMPLLLFCAISAGLFALFCAVVSIWFQTIHSALMRKSAKGNYKMEKLKSSNPFRALVQKELRRFFSTPMYIMNMWIGMVLLTVGAVALLFVSPQQLDEILSLPGFGEVIMRILPLVVSFFVVLTCASACSISLEGKNLWILQSAPVKTLSILQSKILLNVILTIPLLAVDAILLAIGLRLRLPDVLLLFVVAASYALFISVFGLAVNLKFPNLNWASEAVVIKQGMSVVVTILVGSAISIIPFVAFLFLWSVPKELLLFGIAAVLLVAAWFFYRFVKTKGVEIFTKLQ